ncbi:GNAT family N-acetyltransferase [Alteromonas sp. S005]|uniref:GNAT family N-acetyltransferase n=1 Tax=Alteromonas sp. S005 TaxID=3117400 RepID=UPI002FE2EEA5
MEETQWLTDVTWEQLSTVLHDLNCDNFSPFLSEGFLKAWFSQKTFPVHMFLLYEQSTVSHFALIGESFKKKYGLTFKLAHINQTGCPRNDQVWIEYNASFGLPEYRNRFFYLLLKELVRQNFDILNVSMTCEFLFPKKYLSNLYSDAHTSQGFRRSLSREFTVEKIVSCLSANSRSKLRRSLKELQLQFGQINVTIAEGLNQKLSFLEQLKKLHIKRWGDSDNGSGFENEIFKDTLKSLLKNESKLCEIAKVTAGDALLGYTLNLIQKDTVFFYCSGINLDLATKHIRPGYVLHLALMEYYAQQGLSWYDFMGGASQYKKTLSNDTVVFHSLQVPTKTFKGILTRLKNYLTNLKVITSEFVKSWRGYLPL